MKRISVLCAALFMLVLIFFTLYGDWIYGCITPKVKAAAINASVTYENIDYVQIPKAALTKDSCVYIVTAEQGFSRMLFYAQREKVDYIELPDIDADSVYVSSGVKRGDRIITVVEDDLLLEDGERVIIE